MILRKFDILTYKASYLDFQNLPVEVDIFDKNGLFFQWCYPYNLIKSTYAIKGVSQQFFFVQKNNFIKTERFYRAILTTGNLTVKLRAIGSIVIVLKTI